MKNLSVLSVARFRDNPPQSCGEIEVDGELSVIFYTLPEKNKIADNLRIAEKHPESCGKIAKMAYRHCRQVFGHQIACFDGWR